MKPLPTRALPFFILATAAILLNGRPEIARQSAAGSAAAMTTYRDPQNRFTIGVPEGCKASPVRDTVIIICGDAYLTVLKGEAGSPAALLQSLERQFGQQWSNFQRTGGAVAPDGRGGFESYRGTNPRGVPAFMRITASGAGWAAVDAAPQASYGTFEPTLTRIGQSFCPEGDSFFVCKAVSPAPPAMPPPSSPLPRTSTQSAAHGASQALYLKWSPIFLDNVQGNPTGEKVCDYLTPADWQMEGKGIMRVDGVQTYALTSLRVFKPASGAEFGQMPQIMGSWIPMMAPYYSRGSTFMEHRPAPGSAVQALEELAIPRYFPNLRGARLVEQAQDAEVIQSLQQQWRSSAPNARWDAAHIDFEYDENGKTIEERVSCWILVQPLGGGNTWSIGSIRYLKAPKEEVPETSLYARVAFDYMHVDPGFVADSQRAQATSQRTIAMIGESNRQILANNARASNHIHQTWRETAANRTASQEKGFGAFDEAVMGVNSWKDNSGHEYQLPLLNYAYSDGSHVVLSESPVNLPGYSAMQKQP